MYVSIGLPSASLLLPISLLLTVTVVLLIRKRHGRHGADVTRAPAVAGALPFIGNVLAIDRRQPHFTLTDWANVYGHVYRFVM